MKSLCAIHLPSTYQQSESACHDRNMELFVIDNSAVQQALLKATTEFYNTHSALWCINERRESNRMWFTFSPERQSIYSGIDWVNTGTVKAQNRGDCLGYLGPYQAKGVDCNHKQAPCKFFDGSRQVSK